MPASDEDVTARRDLLLVAGKVSDASPRRADRAARIARKRRRARLTQEPVVLKDAAAEWISHPEKDLDDLLRLHAADNAGGGADDAGLFAALHLTRFGRLAEEAAQAGSVWQHRRHLSAPAQHRAVNQWLAQQHRGVVEEELGLERVCAIDHHLVLRKQLGDIGGAHAPPAAVAAETAHTDDRDGRALQPLLSGFAHLGDDPLPVVTRIGHVLASRTNAS